MFWRRTDFESRHKVSVEDRDLRVLLGIESTGPGGHMEGAGVTMREKQRSKVSTFLTHAVPSADLEGSDAGP